MNTNTKNLLSPTSSFAIVGASVNPEKYGYKVLANLLSKGFRVIPVNPKGGEILSQKVYSSVNKKRIDLQMQTPPNKCGHVTHVIL